MRVNDTAGKAMAAVGLVLMLAGAALAPAAAQELGSGQLGISGTRLTVAPESQTVPFDTPTIVETALAGYDAGTGALPAGLRVVADFTGPEVSGVLRLETVPGQPFAVPPLRLAGEYLLSNIRLMDGGRFLAWGEPKSSVVRVDQVLVTRITSRALTLEEIRSYGIVTSGDNFRAFNFTFGFGLDGDTVDFNVPVVYTVEGEGTVATAQLDPVSGRFAPPRLAPFVLQVEGEAESEGGCADLSGNCRRDDVPPIPGVLLFPTELSLLNQFFSVVLLATNGAPAGDPLTIRDLTAKIQLPAGLRQAATVPPTALGVPVPVRVPGPDGEVGTADDLTFLVAQASGEAEFLVEGLREGTHVVRVALEGVLEGLPGGLRRLSGEAKGAVVVRDPTFNVTVTHPDVVRADEEYTLYLTVTNTSAAPANLVTLRLPTAGLAGVEVVGARQATIDTLLPKESELVEFRLRALRTGRVISTFARAAGNLSVAFDLAVGIGEAGVPLSPTTLILPRSTESLPASLVRQGLRLLGLAYSSATAPPNLLSADTPRVSRGRVIERVEQLAEAGDLLSLGEEPFEVAVGLAAQWLGNGDGDGEWDRLRRSTDSGARFGVALGAMLAEEAATTSPVGALERLAAGASARPPMTAALLESSALRLTVTSRFSGAALAGAGTSLERVRALPFGELFDLDEAELVLVARPESSGYRADIRPNGAGGTGDLTLLVRSGNQPARRIAFPSFTLGATGRAWIEWQPEQASGFALFVDADGNGTAESTLSGTATAITPRPFALLAAVQNAERDPAGHLVDVLFSHEVDLLSLVPLEPGRFTVAGKISNGGLLPPEVAELAAGRLRSARLVRVAFDNPLSPYVPNLLTATDLRSASGEALGTQSVPVTTTVTLPGTLVSGQVIGADGTPVPFAEVRLGETDYCPLCASLSGDECVFHTTAAVRADAAGQFFFDYVRQTPCGDLFTLTARDPSSGQRGEARGRVRFIGETVRQDIVLAGRGSVRGRVTYENGSVAAQVRVQGVSPVLQEGRANLTGGSGRYQIDDLPVGTVQLTVDNLDGLTATATVEIPTAGAVVERDLVLVRRPRGTGELRGTVYAAAGVERVADAWVALYVEDELVKVLRSAADGRFDFGLVPAGQATIEAFSGATSQEGARLFFPLEADRVNEIDVLLSDERGAISGHIRRETLAGSLEPIDMATVWAAGTPFNTKTDATGAFRLEGVFAGLQTLSAYDPVTRRQVSGPVTVVDGETVTRDLVVRTAAAEGSIAGQVLDAAGNPVAGATVHRATGPQTWRGEATTGADGRFVLTGIEPGTWKVHAFRGAQGAVGTAEVRFAGDSAFTTIAFASGTVRARVLARAAGGELVPAPGLVRVRTTQVEPSIGLVVLGLAARDLETDAQGVLELPGTLAGPFVLTAVNAAYGEKVVRGELETSGQTVEVDLVFEPFGVVEGTVYDFDGVTPVPGATLRLRHPGLSGYELTSDAAGRFRFEALPPVPAAYPLEVEVERATVLRRARVAVKLDRPGLTVVADVTLPAQGSVAGRVEDASGNPVSGAQVVLLESEYPARRLTREADANGAFSFSNVFAGSVTLSATAPTLGGLGGKLVLRLTQEGQALTDVVVRLQPTGEVRGRVLAPVTNTPVANAEVDLERGPDLFERVTTDGAGEFSFRLLPLGLYRLTAFDPTTGRTGRVEPVTVSANGQVVVRDVALEARGAVAGRLFEPLSNIPVPGATVVAETLGARRFKVYTGTNGEGAYRFDGVPQGRFTLAAQEPGGRRRASGEGEITQEDQELEIDLFLEQAGVVVGTVLAPPGAPEGPFTPVNVVLRQGGEVIGSASTSAYRFEGVLAGQRFRLEAAEPGGAHRGVATGELDREGQTLPLDVRMGAIGAVRVSVVDSVGTPVAGVDVRLSSEGGAFVGSTGGDSSITFPAVPAGELSAFVTDPASQLSGSTTGTLALEGELVELTVELQDAAEVRGVLLLADGTTPAAGALAVLAAGSRTYRVQADAAGAFRFPSVPLGAFVLDLSENLGPGTRRVRGAVAANGVSVDLGSVVLDAADPELVAVAPADGTIAVPVATSITVRLSEPLDVATFSPNWISVRPVGATAGVSYTWSFADGGATVVITPNQPLASFTSYTVRLSTQLVDAAGRRLRTQVATGFTTADVLPPTVVASSPAADAVQVPVDAQLRVTFSEPVAPASLNGPALALVALPGNAGQTTTFQLSPSGLELLVTAAEGFAAETSYRLTVTGVTDLAGNAMSAPFVLGFTTTDATPPQVALAVPAGPLAEGVAVALAATPVASPDLTAVSFFLGTTLLATDDAAPFELLWTPGEAEAAAGTVTLSAVGRDGSGNVGPAAVEARTITPDLPPTLAATIDPAASVLPGGRVMVTGTATDTSGVSKVRIFLSGALTSTTTLNVPNQASYAFSRGFNLPVLPSAGFVDVAVQATDRLGKVTQTAPQRVTVLADTTAPTLSLTAPAPGFSLTAGDSFTAQATATDDVEVDRVVFRFDGGVVTDTTSPYTASFLAPAVTVATAFDLVVEAFDPAGNVNAVSRTVTVQPLLDPELPVPAFLCPQGGDLVVPGQALSFSLAFTDDDAVDSWSLAIDGTPITSQTGVNQSAFTRTAAWTVPAGAQPGDSFVARLEATDFGGNVGVLEVTLSVPLTGTVLTAGQALDASFIGAELVLAGGTYTVTEPLELDRLTVLAGAVVTGELLETLALEVSGPVSVQCGGAIDVTSLGYAGGTGTAPTGGAPAGISGSLPDAGGSHGGAGSQGDAAGAPGATYGSVFVPGSAGGGGAANAAAVGAGVGGKGGGALVLVAQALDLEGEIRARGESFATGSRPAGGGGSVRLELGALSGRGRVDASGGDAVAGSASTLAGAGGGGRVAVTAATLTGFDVASQLVARGGKRAVGSGTPSAYGAPGTVVTVGPGSSIGTLRLDNGTEANGSPRTAAATALPALGTGAVQSWLADGADAWLTRATAFGPEWQGVFVALSDSSGAALGAFRVGELDGAGRLRLVGAGTVAGAASFRGEYRFDDLVLGAGAGLAASDPVVLPELLVAGTAQLAAPLSVERLRVASGAVLTMASTAGIGELVLEAGAEVRPDASGVLALTVERLEVAAGAKINADALGYAGGVTGSTAGKAPAGVTGSLPDAGGSHGGSGSQGNSTGAAGAVYDSVYAPGLGGGGGAADTVAGSFGGAGGGVVTLVADEIVLDGAITARGQSFNVSSRPAGAGGSVRLVAGTLSGSGSIEASGGDAVATSSTAIAGAGGGGRVAIETTAVLTAFNAATQVVARGGKRAVGSGTPSAYGGAGTVYVHDGESTYGRLLLANGTESSGASRVGPVTALPTLGASAVVSLNPAGPDAWLGRGSAFAAAWLGAWVELRDAAGSPLGSFRAIELDGTGRLRLAGAAAVVGATSFRGEYRFDAVELGPGAGLAAADAVVTPTLEVAGAVALGAGVVAERVEVAPNGVLTLSPTASIDELVVLANAQVAADAGGVLVVDVERLEVGTGAVLSADARGFAGGTGSSTVGKAPAGVAGSLPDAGGSHGGAGSQGNASGAPGAIYDSVYRPALAGGGGAADASGAANPGGVGGGVVRVNAGTVVLGGKITAGGQGFAVGGRPAGAGGTVSITAGTLSGAGTIEASGGDAVTTSATSLAGAGGGGRVRLEVGTFSGFDPSVQVRAWGGKRAVGAGTPSAYGVVGTVYRAGVGGAPGRLRIDPGAGRAFGTPTLPALGSGSVASFTVEGVDAWVAAPTAFPATWLGAWMRLADGVGTVLGTFEVTALDGTGRARLAGAGSVVGAATWSGLYRFAVLELANGASLTATDPVEVGELVASGGGVTGPFEFDRLTIGAGATLALSGSPHFEELRIAAGGRLVPDATGVIRLSADTLTIEAGGEINATDRGFSGGVFNHTEGFAPPGVAASFPDAGGSHGGVGVGVDGGGLAGAVFGSVSLPQLGGGGGSINRNSSGLVGGRGGGVIDLTAGTLVLEGQILARGQTQVRNAESAGGAGGSILISADTLSGSGLIDASGGDGLGDVARTVGAGGGGRVAVYVGSSSFDRFAGLRARGGAAEQVDGSFAYAAPGTLFWREGVAETGVLRIDNGYDAGSLPRVGPSTELPFLGEGALAGLTVDGGDAWASRAGGFGVEWLGAWMRLRDAGGADLGRFPVVELDGTGRLRLAGAAVVLGPDSYAGEHVFAGVELGAGAGLVATDPVDAGALTTDGDVRLAGPIRSPSLVLASDPVVWDVGADAVLGAIELGPTTILTAPAGQTELALRADRLVVPAGATISMLGRGFAGGVAGSPAGEAPFDLLGSEPDAGGSHGGAGMSVAGPGAAGEVYDSLFEPWLPGGGGSFLDGGGSAASTAGPVKSSTAGGAGGGVIRIEVDELVVDGLITAAGESGSDAGAGGAGGTLVVRAGVVRGTGLLDVAGGYGSLEAGFELGAGGGGRLVVDAALFDGFDPATQARAGGGLAPADPPSPEGCAASGTALVRLAGGTHGELRVLGACPGAVAQVPTVLPAIGSGLVAASEPDPVAPDDLWFEPADPGTFFSLGVVGHFVRIDGTDYRVVAQTEDRRRLRLEGATATVEEGDAYQGVLKLDRVVVAGEAVLEVPDLAVVGEWVVAPGATVLTPNGGGPTP